MQGAEVLQLAEKSEELVRKSSPASVPLLALIACAFMVCYVMMDDGEAKLKMFFGMALLQMMPLVVLKLKIWTCPERLSLTPILLVKTLLMHLFVIVVRCATPDGGFRNWFDPLALVVGLAMLHKVFGLKLVDVSQHRDVGGLVALCCVLALATFPLVHTQKFYWSYRAMAFDIIQDAGNYADILAFVPVALLVCHESDVESFTPGTAISMENKQRALHFFAFIVVFYVIEDVIEPYLSIQYRVGNIHGFELTAWAHAAHFVMLLDFTGYFICKTWFPSASKITLKIPERCESAGLLDSELEADEEDILA